MKQILYFMKSIHSYTGAILYLNLLGMVFIGLIEGIGILLLIPLLSIIGVLDLQSGSSILSPLFNLMRENPFLLSLPVILLSYVLIMIIQNILQRNQSYLNARIQQGHDRHLRVTTYNALIQANYGFFLKMRKSDISNYLSVEVSRVTAGTTVLLQFLASIIFTVIQIGLAFWLSAELTSLVLLSGLVLLLFSRRFLKKSTKVGTETSNLSESYLAAITDHFNGIKDIKSNTLEQSHMDWFRTLCKKREQNYLEFVKVNLNSQSLFKISSAVLIALFIWAAIDVSQTKPGELMLIIIIFSRLWPRFTSFQSTLEQIHTYAPSFKKLMDLQKECEAAKELANDVKEWRSSKEVPTQQGLECRNVYFRYQSQELVYALKDVSLKIPSKHMTAIVGRSGAGKSTLIDVLMGLITPETGQVWVDGQPLTRHNLASFRQSVSYVAQDPFLFNESVRDNLILIRPDVTENEIWEALEFSSAAEFVRKLPQGLDTVIGDRGIRLSGGERQRLVLARAILKKPSILILDEATSSLDTENERKIQEALERIKGSMTIIVIAHRLSTIRNADQVIVLDQGKIVQQGEFNHLAKEKRGVFSNLLGNQMRASL